MRRSTPPALLALLALLLAACSAPASLVPTPSPGDPATPNAPAAVPGPVTITFGASAFALGTYQPLVDAFNQANPDVQVQLVNLDEALEGGDPSLPAGRRLAAAADTLAAWDFTPGAVERGLVRDLAPFIAADSGFDQQDFYPGAFQNDVNGHVAFLPTTIQLPLLRYNRDLWDERGIPRPTVDWTWADLRAAAEQLAHRDGDTIVSYGLMLATRAELVSTTDLHHLSTVIEAQSSATVDLNSPPFTAAVEEIVQLVRDGVVYTPPEYSDGSFLHSTDYMPLISAGRIGLWRSAYLQSTDAATIDFALGTAPLPASTQPWQFASREGVVMSAGTRHPDQAWRWLAFLSRQSLSPDDSRIEVIPARRSLAEAQDTWRTLDAEGRAAINAMLEQLAAGVPAQGARRNSAAWAIQDAVTQAVAAVLDDSQTPEAALAAAQAGFNEAVAASAQPTASSTATPAPVVVATPAPAATAAPDAARIIFVTTEVGNEQLHDLARRFNAQFPQYFVEVQQLAWPQDGGRVTIGDVVTSGDCALAWGVHSQEDRTALLNLRPLLDADATFPHDDIPAALLTTYTHEGRLYGLPHSVSFRALRYNKSLFDAAGITYPTSTWTVDDMVAAAERLTTADREVGNYGFVPQSAWDLLIYLDLIGVPLVRGASEAARPNFTDPALATAIQAYLELLRVASPAAGITGYDRDQQDSSALLIDEGRVALWFTIGLNDTHGLPPTGFERGFAPVPLTNGHRSAEFFTQGLYIAADSPNPAVCWAWMRFLLDAPSDISVGFPARISLAESPAFLAGAPAGAAELYAAMKPALLAGPKPSGPDALLNAGMSAYWLQRAADRAFQGSDLTRELEDAQFFTEQYQACIHGGEQHATCAKQVDPTYGGW